MLRYTLVLSQCAQTILSHIHTTPALLAQQQTTMGSITDQGDWKGAHMRISSNEPGFSPEDTGSKKGDDVELQARDQGTPTDEDSVGGGRGHGRGRGRGRGSGRPKFQFPRLGLDALIRDGRPEDNGIQDGSIVFYKVYKRRWFGLVELTLLSLLVSWEVSFARSCFCFSTRSCTSLLLTSSPLLRHRRDHHAPL